MNKKTLVALCGALFLSLLGNMFFLGLLLGSTNYNEVETTTEFITDESYQTAQIKDVDKELKKQLPKADKLILRRQMKEIKPLLRQQKQALMNAHKNVRIAMSANNFNQVNLDKALENQRQQRKKMQSIINQMRHKIGANMSPEGRRAFAKMEDRLYNRKSNDHWGKGNKRSERQEHMKKIREQRRNRMQVK